MSFMLAGGKSLRQVGFYLGRSPSSLSRELRRNVKKGRYRPHLAHQTALRRRHETFRKKSILQSNLELRKKVVSGLREGWSPEIIAGFLKKEAAGKTVVNVETIYRWIYSYDKSLIKHLVRSHPKRRPRWARPWPNRLIPERVSITNRPMEINLRQGAGHWEADLVCGGGRPALQVVVERKTRYVRLLKIPNKTSQASYEALVNLLSIYKPSLRQSITYDNGFENCLHREVNARLGSRSYFCEPYHSWEKGTVENTNGLIRRFLPKKTKFGTVSPLQIKKVEDWLNNRPRKCLGFQTPAEALRSAECCTYT